MSESLQMPKVGHFGDHHCLTWPSCDTLTVEYMSEDDNNMEA